MICPDCRQGAMTENREAIRYDESGLPNLVLKDVTVRKCPECGHRLVSIPDLAGLHRCIAVNLVNKPERLMRPEITFLRKSLGWSKADCARKLHVRPEQVSRWESNVSPVPMQLQNELLLRTLVALGQQVENYQEYLEEIATDEPAQSQIVAMRHVRKGWETILKEVA